MKYLKIFMIVGLVFFTSCDPEMIDADPLGPTEQVYFSNALEFRTNMMSVYASLYDQYHFAAPSFNWNGWVAGTWLLPGDDLTENQAFRTSVELFDGSLNPTNTQIGFVFQAYYKTIARANVILDKVETVDFSGFAGKDEIAVMKGEALFLRAYAYYNLFNIYGNVPVITQRIQLEPDTHTPVSPALEVLDQVIADAREAINILPENWATFTSAADVGRANKNSARGLLAKALVFKGNYTNNTAANYTEALTVFNSITASLVSNFIDNFDARRENNNESLFEVQAGQASAGNNLFLHNDGPWRGVENLSVFRGFMIENGGTNGDFNNSASTKFFATQKLLTNFGTDPRIAVFINSNDGFSGRIFQKYHKPDGVNIITPFHGGSANNERVLRYADLKLIAAEAALKTNNPSAAIGHINDVRARARAWAQTAGLGDGTVPAARPTNETNVNTIMQWIMDERYVELAGEGQRWWDLKRWHAAGNINLAGWTGGITHFSTQLASPVQFDVAKHLVFPIPQSEVDRNNAIDANNPGY